MAAGTTASRKDREALLKRIHNELEMMIKDPPCNCSAGPKDDADFTEWIGAIFGPVDSVYEGGVFHVRISFPQNYPFKPPLVNFTTKVYHCNVNSVSGSICLNTLKDCWNPSMTISKVLLSICALLTDPNPHSPLDPIVAREYIRNREEHDKNAKQWTLLYASK